MATEPSQGRTLPHSFDQAESVRAGHLRIQQDQGKRRTSLGGLLQGGDRLRLILGQGGIHLPAQQRLLKYAPVGGVIVYHQYVQAAQHFHSDGFALSGARSSAKARSAVK